MLLKASWPSQAYQKASIISFSSSQVILVLTQKWISKQERRTAERKKSFVATLWKTLVTKTVSNTDGRFGLETCCFAQGSGSLAFSLFRLNNEGLLHSATHKLRPCGMSMIAQHWPQMYTLSSYRKKNVTSNLASLESVFILLELSSFTPLCVLSFNIEKLCVCLCVYMMCMSAVVYIP